MWLVVIIKTKHRRCVGFSVFILRIGKHGYNQNEVIHVPFQIIENWNSVVVAAARSSQFYLMISASKDTLAFTFNQS